MKVKTTKRALLMSLLSLLLCVSMLVGTTFAWFTDSVTSGINKIVAGNLDVELYTEDGAQVTTATELFSGIELWEPGVVAYENLTVVNKGNLAFKYNLGVLAENATVVNGHSLDEALKIAVVDGGFTGDREAAKAITNYQDFESFSLNGELKAKDDSKTFGIVIYWEPTANDNWFNMNNENQGKVLSIDLGVKLLATQLTYEKDSFDEKYDEMATVDSLDELAAALNAGNEVLIQLGANLAPAESIVIPAGKKVTLDLAGYTISQAKGDLTTAYALIDNKGELTIEDSVGSGKISFADTTPYTADIGWASNTIRNTGVLTVNGGTVENTTAKEVMSFSYPHAIDVYQGSVTTINGGTVKSANYDAIRMFCNSDTLATTVNITGGTIVNRISFQDPNAAKAGYGVLNISGGKFVSTADVTANVRLLNFCNDPSNMKATVTGGTFDKGFKTQDIVNAGVKTSDWLTYNGTSAVATAAELADALAAGEDVTLTADITGVNANTAITVASGKDVTLDLNGHTISATADKTGNQELFLVKGTMTVKNGSLALAAQNNQGWNSMATIFDVTAGGALSLDGVTATVGGTDMNFIAHLNNWGSATLYVNDCDFTASYVAVRVFNSGYDMNTVTIKNTDFHTGRMFWVHNYTSEGCDDSTLTLDIYGNNNTTDNAKPVRFGFSNAVYYDINGNVIS